METLDKHDIELLQSLDRLMDMHRDEGTKRLCDCGWADFYGISIGGKPLDADKLLGLGVIEARPSDVWENTSVYRITGLGWDAIDGLPTIWDEAFAADPPLVRDESEGGR